MSTRAGLPPQSKIVADLSAISENYRLGRDGGFVPAVIKPVVWTYDPQMGSSFDRQRVDSRFSNSAVTPSYTSVRRKVHKQYLSAEAARKQNPTYVQSRAGGEQALPGPAAYRLGGTFGRPNANARIVDAPDVKFRTTERFPPEDGPSNPGVGAYRGFKGIGGTYV